MQTQNIWVIPDEAEKGFKGQDKDQRRQGAPLSSPFHYTERRGEVAIDFDLGRRTGVNGLDPNYHPFPQAYAEESLDQERPAHPIKCLLGVGREKQGHVSQTVAILAPKRISSISSQVSGNSSGDGLVFGFD